MVESGMRYLLELAVILFMAVTASAQSLPCYEPRIALAYIKTGQPFLLDPAHISDMDEEARMFTYTLTNGRTAVFKYNRPGLPATIKAFLKKARIGQCNARLGVMLFEEYPGSYVIKKTLEKLQ